jgi:biotin carboxylase
MKKVLLILGAGHDQLFMIRTARRMGLHTISLDWNPNAPGFAESDEYAQISTRNLSAIFKFVDLYQKQVGPIHGVCTMGSDIPHVVSAVAHHIGTPGISEQSARWATNKFEMKERFRQAGVRIPWYRLVESAEAVRETLASHGGPMVIKPLDQAGSRGVSLITCASQAEALFAHARDNTANSSVLLEAFVPGPQISTESILLNGEIYTPGYADRNYDQLEEFLPLIIENGGWVPSLYEARRYMVETEIRKAALALGITDGVVKGDVVLGTDGPTVIEIAARLSGGDFCESLVPLGLGVNYVEAVIRLSVGDQLDLSSLKPQFQRTVANRYFFGAAGVLKSIRGVEEVSKMDWLTKLDFWYRPGDRHPEILSHGQRTGVFVVTGPDRETVQERVDFVYRTVRIEIEEVL